MRMKHLSSKGLGPLGIMGLGPLGTVIVVVSFFLGVALLFSIYGLGFNLWDIFMAIRIRIGIWFVLIGGGVVLIIFSLTMLQFSKSMNFVRLAKLGMIMITLSVVVLLVQVIVPLFSDKVLTYEECKSFIGDVSKTIDEKDIYRMVSCVFAGYSPTSAATPVTYVNFIITAIIAPFVFFYYIFADLIESMNFPQNPGAQRAIAFIGAYSALRGAMASYFVEFFAYSWYGMGVLAFGVFMMMMAWSLVKRYFEDVIESEKLVKIFRILGGEIFVTKDTLFRLLCENRDTFDFLNSNVKQVEDFLTKSGYSGNVMDVNRILVAATAMRGTKRAKNNYVRNELRKIFA